MSGRCRLAAIGLRAAAASHRIQLASNGIKEHACPLSTSTRRRARRQSSSSPRSPTSGRPLGALRQQPDDYLKVQTRARPRLTSPRAPAASGNACTTTGPIPRIVLTTTDSNAWGAARATPTPSRGGPRDDRSTRRGTRRQELQGPIARDRARNGRQGPLGRRVRKVRQSDRSAEQSCERGAILVDASRLCHDDHP